jgi:hypothetical protein
MIGLLLCADDRFRVAMRVCVCVSAVKSLEKRLDSKQDSEVTSTAAFAFGCLFRGAAGSPAMRVIGAQIPFAVAVLQALSRDLSSEALRLSILHALWMVMSSAPVQPNVWPSHCLLFDSVRADDVECHCPVSV